MHASSQRPKTLKAARSRLRHAGTYGDMRTGPHQVLADTARSIEIVTRGGPPFWLMGSLFG